MKIGIIGFGYVGSAIGWAHRRDDIVIHDPKMPDSVSKAEMLDCDAIYVCVPSPEAEEGYCDSSILEETLKDLLLVSLRGDVPIICKTTAPPSVYERLHKQYPNIVYSPEFLTARNHISDYKTTEVFILGGDVGYCEKARDVIMQSDIQNKQFLLTDVKTASLFKYMMNSYLAMKVTFMNEFKELADAHDVNWQEVRELAKYDRRIGNTHMHVPGPDGEYGWGGACFPKDIAAITMEAIDQGLEFELMQRVETINRRHRKMK